MRALLTTLAFSLVALTALPTQAAPNKQTQVWESLVVPTLQTNFCKAKSGTMTRLFKISSAACKKTFNYSAEHCVQALHQIPYYQVWNKSSGESWGRMLGMCVGIAFDMKYTAKKPLP